MRGYDPLSLGRPVAETVARLLLTVQAHGHAGIAARTVIAWGLRVHVAPAKRRDVDRILRSLLGPARVRGGCLACRVYQDLEDPEVLALVQEWDSPDDLARYLRSEDYPMLLAVIESAAQQPEIWFDTIATREGLERLAAVRGAR